MVLAILWHFSPYSQTFAILINLFQTISLFLFSHLICNSMQPWYLCYFFNSICSSIHYSNHSHLYWYVHLFRNIVSLSISVKYLVLQDSMISSSGWQGYMTDRFLPWGMKEYKYPITYASWNHFGDVRGKMVLKFLYHCAHSPEKQILLK